MSGQCGRCHRFCSDVCGHICSWLIQYVHLSFDNLLLYKISPDFNVSVLYEIPLIRGEPNCRSVVLIDYYLSITV